MAKANKEIEDLFYASVVGDTELLKKAVQAGADVNEKDEDGSTPLMLAAVNGKMEAVDFLLKNGADATLKDNDGWDAATLAKNAGYDEVAKMLQGGRSSQKTESPEGLEELAIIGFVEEKADEIKNNLEEIREGKGSDEGLIKETNQLGLLLFAETNSFYKSVDAEVRSAINGTLEYLNEDFAKTSDAIGRGMQELDVDSIKNYDISKLLGNDEKMLRSITKEIYNAIISFANEELDIGPSEFSIKYNEYHKRLLQMRDALLESLRTVGKASKGTEERVRTLNMIAEAS